MSGNGGEHRGIFTIDGELPIQSFPRDITYRPVEEPVWTASEGIYRTIFIEAENSVIAFDTFSTPGGARSYRDAIERLFPNKPVETIVYSHDHLDHTGYAADLNPDAEIVAHELCNNVIEARESDGQLPASETLSGEWTRLEIDGRTLELIYPGPTHGDGNLAVFLPEQALLFMVDTVIPGVGYTFFPDWHLEPYLDNMRRLLSLDWETFVPGHFWSTDRDGFRKNLKYYEEVRTVAEEALVSGIDPMDLDDVRSYAEEKLNAYEDFFRYNEYVGQNLMRYMLQLKTGGWGTEGVTSARTGELSPGSEVTVTR